MEAGAGHDAAASGVARAASLSPSRAADFLSCALRFRFRTIDRLAEPTSTDALRGTLVHRVLEVLFDEPAVERTPATAHALVVPAWKEILVRDPALADAFAGPHAPGLPDWLESCHAVIDRWFELEDPTRLEPAERELFLETPLDSGLVLRGIVDRVDVAPDGAVRIVDYKTGNAVREGYESRAFFQLRIYAAMVGRVRGVVPTMLQLVYLGDGVVVRSEVDADDLAATERKVEAIWRAMSEARATGEWQPHRGRQCDWCSFKALCPAWGGTPPPLPEVRVDRAAAAAPPPQGRDALTANTGSRPLGRRSLVGSLKAWLERR